MAINYSYPIADPAIGDILIGSKHMGEDGLITKSFTIGDILSLGNGEVGPEGPQGPPGPAGLTWRDTWLEDNEYSPGDVAEYEGTSYVCINPIITPLNPAPPDDPGNWDILAAKGDTGEPGPQLQQAPFTMKVNNTGSTALPTETNFRSPGQQVLTTNPIFSDSQTPTGTVNKTYNWQRVGNIVTVTINVEYVTYTVTTGDWIRFDLPADMPNPINPTGFSGSDRVNYTGIGSAYSNDTSITQDVSAQTLSLMRNNGSSEPAGYHFLIPYTVPEGGSFKAFRMTLQYFTA